ncbi:MAG TPA: signal peptidase I [Thermoanaerobaculia bacterium]|nr:signal peptidase I [Thermoanaerobaculia bacterium]
MTHVHRHSTLRETFEALLVAGLFLLFVNTWIFRTFFIPSGSMENTLLVGDHLAVNRYIYGPAPTALERKLLPAREPRRGDIVVFRSVERPSEDLVKRLIGMPGDVIELRGKQLFLNGKPVADEGYAIHKDPLVGGITSLHPRRIERDQFGPYRVPADSYFMMGDNRDESADSRFWGPLPRTYVKGRANLIYWSFGGEAPPAEWKGWRQQVSHLARTAVGFLTHTRWRRTFDLPH